MDHLIVTTECCLRDNTGTRKCYSSNRDAFTMWIQTPTCYFPRWFVKCELKYFTLDLMTVWQNLYLLLLRNFVWSKMEERIIPSVVNRLKITVDRNKFIIACQNLRSCNASWLSKWNTKQKRQEEHLIGNL